QALARMREGAILIDVRGEHERALGMAEGARGIDRAALEADPDGLLPGLHAEILLLCQRGQRSQQVAMSLEAHGYRNLASVVGGTEAWDAAGLPMQRPDIDADFSERYSRHLRLPEVGLDGQQRLQASRMLLVGAGGL